MKKNLATILAVLMLITLFACGNNGSSDATTTPTAASTPTPETAATEEPASATTGKAAPTPGAENQSTPATPDSTQEGTAPSGDYLDEIGFYNPDFDYDSGTRYKVQYMSQTTGILYETNNNIYKQWAKQMNMEYGDMWNSNGDMELFINNISTFAAQGVNGFLFDPDITYYSRIAEVCDELGVAWMPCMGDPRDMTQDAMPLLHPYTGFDHYQLGEQQAEKLLDYKNSEWPDVPLDEVGFIALDFSAAPPIHNRVLGAKAVWEANGGNSDNFMVADTVTGNMDMDTAYQQVNALVSTNSQFTHWLVCGEADDLASGAASAIENLGLDNVSCIVCVGGPGLYAQWDAGIQNSWKFVLATGEQLFGEPTMGALYAFMAGLATPDTIWPSWLDINDHGGEGHSYAKLLLPTFWCTFDNYQAYLEWSDTYGNVNTYNYDIQGLTRDSFPSRAVVPASYGIPNG